MKFISSRYCCRRHIPNRLRFESLEERLALATHVWTGAISSLWSNSGNWTGGSPGGDSQAVLSFPSAANLVNNNDLVGLKVAAIDFAAGNYVLSGNPITLVQGPQGIPRLHMDAAAKNNTIALDLGRAAIGIAADIASGSTLNVTGVIGGGAAATNLVKEGLGKLVMAGANTFADGVLISAGVLNIQNGTALGTTGVGATNKTTLNGGTLELQGSLFVTETIVQGAAGGTLRNVSGNSRWAGEVILASTDLTTQVEGLTSLTIDGKISDNASLAGLGLTKTGPGTLVLTAASTYRGVTLVNEGVLNINNPFALGTADGGTTMVNSSRLELQGFITVAEPIVLDNSTLLNRSGNNEWQGPVTLVRSPVFDLLADTLTISGVIGGNAGFTLVSDAPAKLILSGANTFTGPVSVFGILNLRNALALGPVGGSTVSIKDGWTLELELPGTGSFSRSLNLRGQGVGGNGALRNLGGNNTWAGPFQVNSGDNPSIDVSGGQLTISSNITNSDIFSDGRMTKLGNGPLFLSGNCNLDTTINAGSLFVNGSVRDVILNGGLLGGTGTVDSIKGTGTVNPGVGAGRLIILRSALSFRREDVASMQFNAPSVFEVDLNGMSAGASYDQLRVSYRPDLQFAILNVHLNFFPTVGTAFRIIDNNDSPISFKPIVGTFSNLPEGTIISTARGNLRISYLGGDGNDVVLTVVSSPLVIPPNTPSRFPDRSVTPVIDEGDLATLTGTISDPDLHDVFFLDVDWGDGKPAEKHVFPPGSNGKLVQLTHRYLDDKPTGTKQDEYHIQLDWHDKAGEGSRATLTTTVRNVAPVVHAFPEVQLRSSGLLHQLVSFTDPGRDKWTATVDFGDGGGPQPVDVKGVKQLLLHHRYQQPGTYLVRVAVLDDDGGVGRTSFRVRWVDRLDPSRADAFYAWFDDYQQQNKPRRPSPRSFAPV